MAAPTGTDPLARFATGSVKVEGSFRIGLALARWVTEAQGGSLTMTSPLEGEAGFPSASHCCRQMPIILRPILRPISRPIPRRVLERDGA